MEQIKMKKNKLVQIILIAIVLVVGLIMSLTIGFNKELKYKDHEQIQLYLEKEFNEADIREITNEVFEGQEVIIQEVELYKDTVLISTKSITDEQKTNLINKINEKYQTTLTTDTTKVQTIAKTRIRDILKQYIWTFVITSVIILVYMAIRFRKLNSLKVVIKTIFALVISEATLFAVMAITQIPIGKFTVAIIFTIYVLVLFVITSKFENKLTKLKAENEEKKKK